MNQEYDEKRRENNTLSLSLYIIKNNNLLIKRRSLNTTKYVNICVFWMIIKFYLHVLVSLCVYLSQFCIYVCIDVSLY